MSESPARLEVRGVTKTYGAVRALSDVSFDLRPGEVHALLGHNGAGKSTLVKVLSGLIQPDEGVLVIDGQEVQPRNPRHAQALGIALVDQELSLVPTLTVQENLLLGATRGGAPSARRLRGVLDDLGLDAIPLNHPLGRLSLGEQQLVEIARALSRDARILILDEPTATLSEHEIEMVFTAVRRMASDGRSIIYVSHRLGEILSLCQRATVFRDGKCIGTEEVSRLDRESIIAMMLGHLPALNARQRHATDAPPVVTVRDLAVPPRLSGFNLDLVPGRIVGLAGQVGCGASEVLRAVAGLDPEATGDVTVSGRRMRLGSPRRAAAAGVLYTTSDRKQEGLYLTHSIARNIVATRLRRLSHSGVMSTSLERTATNRLMSLTGIAAQRRRTPVGALSGGNQQKVLVARSLDVEPSVLLVLDEPTRGVDVGGRQEIHELIRSAAASGAAVVFSSTELDEVLDLADTVVTMFGGKVVDAYDGDTVTAAQVLTDMTHGRTPERAA